MKQEPNKTAPASTLPAITQSSVRDGLIEIATKLDIPMGSKATCSASQYGMLIMITLMEHGILDREKLPAAMTAWSFIPKNPSAMRQVFENADKASTSPAANALLSKYLNPDSEA